MEFDRSARSGGNSISLAPSLFDDGSLGMGIA